MRLDAFLVEKGFFDTRSKATNAIKRGEVFVNGVKAEKPSKETAENDAISILAEKAFVSVGGFKLDKALEEFGVDCKGRVFADIGASTGGFTDALLKRGAKTVFAVDVGKDLLDESLKNDPRVVVMDGVNARYLTENDFSLPLDGAVVDCSFISIRLILPTLVPIVKGGTVIALIKPQFECGGEALSKNGLLLGEDEQKKVVSSVYGFCKELGLGITGFTHAPLFKKKNVEYLAEIGHSDSGLTESELMNAVASAYKEWRGL